MADYHPLIARAVAGLDKNTGENRRTLYERARTALVAQLRGVQPALDESEITRERLALEEAIRKVEAESARQARETARPTFIKRAEIPRREEPPRQEAPRQAPQRPESQRQDTPREPPPRPAMPTARSIAPPPSAPPAPLPRGPVRPSTLSAPRSLTASTPAAPPSEPQRPAGGRRTLQDEALKGFREVANDPNAAAEARRTERYEYPEPSLPPAPSLPPVERHPLEEYGQLEPQMQPENLWALPLDHAQSEPQVNYDEAERYQGRPHAQPRETEPQLPRKLRPPRSYARLIRMSLVVLLIALAGGMVYWQRGIIADIAGGVVALFRSPGAPPREAATPSRPKITDRIGQPSTQPSGGPAVAQRVVLYEEDPDDSQGKRFVGTVLWRTEMRPATPGRPPELAVRADIEVPERKMGVTWSLRRNTDQSLPASHTIEIVFNLPADSPSGGVQNVPGVLMKQSEQTRGVPLAGLAVKVTPGYFLIGLSAIENDMQRNVQLLKERAWFDIPIVYNNNRRAILALEKGTPGEKSFNDAFAAWKQ